MPEAMPEVGPLKKPRSMSELMIHIHQIATPVYRPMKVVILGPDKEEFMRLREKLNFHGVQQVLHIETIFELHMLGNMKKPCVIILQTSFMKDQKPTLVNSFLQKARKTLKDQKVLHTFLCDTKGASRGTKHLLFKEGIIDHAEDPNFDQHLLGTLGKFQMMN